MTEHTKNKAPPNNIGNMSKYYYMRRVNTGVWAPICRPFLVEPGDADDVRGSFISSNWFKICIPKEYECAVITLFPDISHGNKKSIKENLDRCAREMNNCENVKALSFVATSLMVDASRLMEIQTKLENGLKNEAGTDITSFRESFPASSGEIGWSFAMRRGETPCLYCPSFAISHD